eukprot:TRINITY_DN1339_c0_g1_i3.p1 TRINITY_DN1339_c0_g1~~TRINITY_DN1339_c0_g1_i3.p1  ORF type:complete len:164 (-),score=30.04 TRINITY_DN1339_c0_g1_i3:96-587(-)
MSFIIDNDDEDLEVSKRFTKDQLEYFEEGFKLFDKDGDGTITAKELQDVMVFLKTPISPQEALNMIAEVDTDGSGAIEYPEFLTLMSRRLNTKKSLQNFDDDIELRGAFDAFDLNKDGFITAHELRTVMASVGEPLTDEELWTMIRETDTDNDGKVTFDDFES